MTTPVWRRLEFSEIGSTNALSVERARLGEPAGLVIRSDFQSAGRGRRDRTWEAPSRSSLLTSILLRPQIPSEQIFLVTLALALAAREAMVVLTGVRPDVKWPNDLLVGGKKISGILAEFVPHPAAGDAVVIGIGINLTFTGPPDAQGTSLRDQSGVTVSPEAMLDMLLRSFSPRLALTESVDGRDQLLAEYEVALVTKGVRVRLELPDESFEAEALGVDARGRLRVRRDDGSESILDVADVSHVRPAGSA